MKEIIVITFLFSLIVITSGFTKQTHVALTCLLLLYLVWHFLHIFLLKRYLTSGNLKPSRVYGIWKDIFFALQRLKQNNFVNRHNHHKLQIELIRFLERYPDAVVFMDRNNLILWANSAALELLGVSLTQNAGENLIQVITDEALIEHLDTSVSEQHFEILSPVNQSTILSCQIYRPRNLELIVFIARDITQAYYAQQSRKDFVSNVSHELKTPLTVIKGFLELMSDSKQELGQWAKSASLMQTQADRMGKLINSLLLLSKIQQDQATDQDEQVNAHDMLLNIIVQAELAYADKKPVFTHSIRKDMLLIGSETYLYSIFSNLIVNAIIHNAPQCQIKIDWQTGDNGNAVFIVDDRGEGIAPRHLNRLTERFYRVDKGRSQNAYNSTGLGLAIVKHALQYHQAQLKITSKTGHGSTFRCEFPVHRTVITTESRNDIV